MKILILEDSVERIEWFKKVYRNHELFIFTDLISAKNFIMFHEIDVFFLDHDLETRNLEAVGRGDTGYDFCKFIVDNFLAKQSVFFIHSMNPCGAAEMEAILKRYGYEAQWIPFHLLKLEDRNA